MTYAMTMPATYHAYVSRRGTLIVRRYLGPGENARIKRFIRDDLGTFRAADAAEARRVANELRGAK